MTKTIGSRKGSSKDRHPDFISTISDIQRRSQSHAFLGYVRGTIKMVGIGQKDEKTGKEIQLPQGVSIYQFIGWDIGKKYTGSRLRELRKKNGVGRPRKTESDQAVPSTG